MGKKWSDLTKNYPREEWIEINSLGKKEDKKTKRQNPKNKSHG